MADQATKSIRRIVQGLKDDPNGLGLADDYKGLGTSRGEAFINARGDVTGSSSTGSGDDIDEQPSSGTPGTGNPDDNDTGGGGGINTGSDPVEALSGDADAVVPAIDTDTQVGTVTGTDPTTTDPVSFNPNTLAGIEYVPPDTWDDPDVPPTDPTFDPNRFYEAEGVWTSTSSTTTGLIAALRIEGPFPVEDWTAVYNDAGNIPDNDVTFDQIEFPFSQTVIGVTHADCSEFPWNVIDPPLCSVPDYAPDEVWPSDGSCQVVYDNAAGGFKGNERDPDCSAAQKIASQSIIIRSVDDPNKYYKFTRLADGGTKITEVDSGGTIIPDSVIKTIDAGGRFGDVYPDTLDGDIL